MPLLGSDYSPPAWHLRQADVQTVYAALLAYRPAPQFRRERIETPDQDFLDLDWIDTDSNKLAILGHGLEGCSQAAYILKMADMLHQNSWNVLAWNMRGCSGEPNRKLAWYHSGKSDDLDIVVRHVLSLKKFKSIILVGFSIGGNIVLKYLGELGAQVPTEIKASVTFSVPCNLESSAMRLEHARNRIYLAYFMRSFAGKVKAKSKVFPEEIRDEGVLWMNFLKFDSLYTAPLNGYPDAVTYWRKNSCINVLPSISIPSLLISSCDDPFLTPECFPHVLAKEHPNLYLKISPHGGHVAFLGPGSNGLSWINQQTLAFVNQYI